MTRAQVAMLLINDTNDYQRLVRHDAEEGAQRAGIALDVHIAGNDFTTQIRQLYGLVNRPPEARPRLAVLFPVRDGSLEYALRDAARAGIGCVLLNRRPKYLGALRREFPNVPFGSVGPDQVEMGRIQARQASALLPGGGFALYVVGPGLSSAAQDRLQGFRDELAGTGIEHSVVHGDWDREVAQGAVLKWLRVVLVGTQRVDLVVCQNDAMALGARQALDVMARERNRPELLGVRLTGVDGSAHVGQALVGDGTLAATIIQSSTGRPAIEWAARCLDGKPRDLDVVLPVTPFPDLARTGAFSEIRGRVAAG